MLCLFIGFVAGAICGAAAVVIYGIVLAGKDRTDNTDQQP